MSHFVTYLQTAMKIFYYKNVQFQKKQFSKDVNKDFFSVCSLFTSIRSITHATHLHKINYELRVLTQNTKIISKNKNLGY